MLNAQPSWTTRIWREHRAGNLTRAERDVALTLATYRDRGGIAWPAHATLAARVRCSVRTVQRALAQAQRLGLVRWTARRVRAGWRSLQTSNVYRLVQPIAPVRAGMRSPASRVVTGGHSGRGGESEINKVAMNTLIAAAQGLPDLLAMRRLAVEAAQVKAWSQHTTR